MSELCPVCGNAIANESSSCLACGFKLLGSTQSFEPVSIAKDDVSKGSLEGKSASFLVIRGPQKDVVFKLGESVQSMGRSPQCDIFLNDMTVSRVHAAVTPTNDGYIISDEHSYNGVWVNNENVESKLLEPGDIIQIGVFCLLYRLD